MYAVTTTDWHRAIRVSLAVLILGTLAFLAVLVAAIWGHGKALISDRGIVQVSTAVMLIAASAYSALLSWRHREQRLNLGLLAFILAIYACRECDLHQASFLAEHVTRGRFYRMPGVPLWQKVLFASLIVATGIAIVVFLFRTLAGFFRDLKHRRAWTLFAVLWFVTLFIAQVSDKSPLNFTLAGQALEEVLEAVAAGFALLVVSHFPRNSGATEVRQ